MENPDVWIEDVRRYGPCQDDGVPISAEIVDAFDDVDGIEASFCVITDVKNNRIVIRHHF